MKRILFPTVVCGLFVACAPSTQQDSTLAGTSGEVTANCFSEVNPGGSVLNGQYDGVYFFNGSCHGSSKALNKLSYSEQVTVNLGGSEQSSKLYLKGNAVSVKVNDEFRRIGTMKDTELESKFLLDAEIEVKLLVTDKNGQTQAWEYGDNATYVKERIVVNL